jgi:arylsulfatase A-like enzyme
MSRRDHDATTSASRDLHASDRRPTRDVLPALALALPLQKIVLLVALARVHAEPIGFAGGLAPLGEAGVALLLLLVAARTRDGSPIRRLTLIVAWLLVLASWLAVAPWGFTGTVVPLSMAWSLLTSPAIVSTALSQRELLVPLIAWTLGLPAVLLVAAALARIARPLRFLQAYDGRRSAALAIAGLAAIALPSLRGDASPLARPALLVALGDDRTPVLDGTAAVDPAAERELSGPSVPRRVSPSPARNVLVVVLESVRFEPDSPFVRGFPDALHFDRVYAHQARSVKTLEALLFGIYPSLARETAAFAIDQYEARPDGALPSLLRTHGFATSYLGAMDLRFENYQRVLAAAGLDRVEHVTGGQTLTWGVPARTVFARAAQVLAEGRATGQRQLVVVWTTECHRPYDSVAAAGTTGSDRERYHACQATLAEALQGMLADLAASGARDDTLVIAFGDHGQLFSEDRGDEPVYGQNVHERALHVPLLTWLPDGFTFAGERPDRRLFQLVDVPATIAAATGVVAPAAWVGRDLLDAREPGREFVVLASLLDGGVLGVVEASGRKVASARDGSVLAYDLASDPDERRGVAQQGAAKDRDLARMQTYRVVTDERWGSRVDTVAAREQTFRGAALDRFGRVGVCLRATTDPQSGTVQYAPSDLPRCQKHKARRRELVRSLQGDVLASAAALRVELELRLDDAGDDGTRTPRARVRLGERDQDVAAAAELKLERDAWQTVRVTVPVSDELRARLRTSPAATVELGITPVDQPLPFSLASIHVAAVAP